MSDADLADPEIVVRHLAETNRSLLASVRRELRAPANTIIGTSGVLLEDATNLGRQRFFAELQHIHSLGKQLLAYLNDRLDPSILDGRSGPLDLAPLGASVRLQLRNPANEIIDCCDDLMAQAEDSRLVDFLADLQRIRAAAVSLFSLTDDLLDVGNRVSEPGKDNRPQILSANVRSGHVLVVDDSAFHRDILARGLYRQGHHFTLAQNGRQGLELIASQAFDLMLLDIIMPEMNGIQVLEHLKADPQWRLFSVVVLSALDEIDSVVRCLQLGADDYLIKPFHPVLLKARVGNCLERTWLRERERQLEQEIQKEQKHSTSLLRRLQPTAGKDVQPNRSEL